MVLNGKTIAVQYFHPKCQPMETNGKASVYKVLYTALSSRIWSILGCSLNLVLQVLYI